MDIRFRASIVALSLCTSTLAFAQALPEAVTYHKEMVVSANPLASQAGAKILKQGGTAVDAMLAVQTVLGLVEPQSSGLGGGAFVVYYDAKSGRTLTLDAREKAPAAANEDRFAGLGFFPAWQSGLSVGVPGIARMMEHLHDKYGRLPTKKLFADAIKLAEQGFALTDASSAGVTGLLARNDSCDERLYFRDPVAFEYFANPDCSAKPGGTLITNQAYADTLKAMVKSGADAFYQGPIAEDIAAAVQSDSHLPGDMTTDDLANYAVVERDPVCFGYQGYKVCGMGPPSSGALAVGQILGILEHFELAGRNPLDEEVVHWFTQAGRLAFADRARYVADSDFVSVPVDGMLDQEYLAARAALITSNDMGSADAGEPPGAVLVQADDPRVKLSGTSHVSIVDRYGNALSMTTTIESSFGNGVMVRGFLLNNELTDFSFAATDNGRDIANRVQANKRPRSSMSPTIVFDHQGRVAIVTGSPGGSRIIGYTAQSIMNIIDFGLDPQQAINLPHYMNRNTTNSDIETPIPGVTLDYDSDALRDALLARGHLVGVIAQTSGLSVIQVLYQDKKKAKGKSHLVGGADHRRDGTISGR